MGESKIIVTTAAAVAALLADAQEQAHASTQQTISATSENKINPPDLNSRNTLLEHMTYQLGQDTHALTLQRSESGILLAGHGSHVSHGSHGSHGSHRSGM